MPAHFVRRDFCPACHSSNVRTVFSRSYDEPHLRSVLQDFYGEPLRREYSMLDGATFALDHCGGCGLVFQKDVPDAVLLERLYTTWIDPDEARRAHERSDTATRRLDLVRTAYLSVSLIETEAGSRRALDFGSGWGEWAAAARAFADESCGVELSEERRHYCQARGIRMLREEELPADSFDLINLEQVLEHLPDPRRTLIVLAAALRPGGVIHIAVPNGRAMLTKLPRFDREIDKPLGGAMHAVAPLQHLNCFDFGSLTALAADCGLTRVRPSWDSLLRTAAFPGPPLRRAAKVMLRPAYQRSRLSTDLHFVKPKKSSPAAPAICDPT